jgi:hypothetical protein
MKLTFQLGFAFVLLGVALACFINYLDMRQFEARLDQYIAHTSVSDYFGLVQILKSKDISPEMATRLNDQLSRVDISIKNKLENIRSEVSQKKSKALQSLSLFLCLAAMMGIVNYSTILKAKAQTVTFRL